MTLDGGLAQAVSAKGANKEGWSQAEPLGSGGGGHLLFTHLHPGAHGYGFEREQEIVEGGNG